MLVIYALPVATAPESCPSDSPVPPLVSTCETPELKKVVTLASESEEEQSPDAPAIDWAAKTVSELRQICKQKGVDAKGKKQVLVDRLNAISDPTPDSDM